jgi:hypothetical protein
MNLILMRCFYTLAKAIAAVVFLCLSSRRDLLLSLFFAFAFALVFLVCHPVGICFRRCSLPLLLPLSLLVVIP